VINIANSGVSDKIQILKETTYGDGGGAGEVVFGVTRTFQWRMETNSAKRWALESAGPGATFHTDGVMLVSGTHEWELNDGREFEAIIGTMSSGANNFSITAANSLPSYSVKVVEDAENSTFGIIKGLKYTKFTISASRDGGAIMVTGDWLARTYETTTTFTPTVATVEPLTDLHTFITIGTTAQTEVDAITFSIDRKGVARRFIEQTSSNEKRLISQIKDGVLDVTFDGAAAVKRSWIQQVWGSTSLQDTRTDTTFKFSVERGNSKFYLMCTNNARVLSAERTLDKEAEIALLQYAGSALGVVATGSYI
jgi:hypothetical protein